MSSQIGHGAACFGSSDSTGEQTAHRRRGRRFVGFPSTITRSSTTWPTTLASATGSRRQQSGEGMCAPGLGRSKGTITALDAEDRLQRLFAFLLEPVLVPSAQFSISLSGASAQTRVNRPLPRSARSHGSDLPLSRLFHVGNVTRRPSCALLQIPCTRVCHHIRPFKVEAP